MVTGAEEDSAHGREIFAGKGETLCQSLEPGFRKRWVELQWRGASSGVVLF